MSFLCYTGQSKPYTAVEGGPAEAIEYLIAQGFKKGFEEGFKKGFEEGFKKGFEKGLIEGGEKADRKNVLRFATFGITPERTSTLLNLPLVKVKSILEGK